MDDDENDEKDDEREKDDDPERGKERVRVSERCDPCVHVSSSILYKGSTLIMID